MAKYKKGRTKAAYYSLAKIDHDIDGLTCEYPGCNEPVCDRHHKDGNIRNSHPDNVQLLCRWHHMKVDGRLKKVGGWLRNARDK